MAAALTLSPSDRPTTRPRRRSAVLGAIAIVAAASMLTSCMTSTQAKTLGQLNTSRNQNGMRSLGDFTQSVDKAQAWADHLASVGYLTHSRLQSSYSTTWCALGENIGYGPSTSAIESAFMNSPDHRANILSGTWNYAGTGVAVSNGTVYVVQEFIKTC